MTDLIKRDDAPEPCPFCGDDPWFDTAKSYGDSRYMAMHLECCDIKMHKTMSYSKFWNMPLEDITAQLKRDLIAAWNTRALPAVAVGVKPLVWRGNGKGRVCADTPFGAYEIGHGRYGMRLRHGGSCMQDDLQGIEAAKAAAQADYEARILAALTPAPVADSLPAIDPAAIREAALREAAAEAERTPTCLLPSGHFLSERCRDAILALIGETK